MSTNLSKLLRDTGIAIASLLLTSATEWLNNGGLNGTKYAGLAAVLLIAIQAARRYLFPEPTPAIAMNAPPKLALDFPTPSHAFSVANDQSDEQFLLSCAGQITAYSPVSGRTAAAFDPSIIIAILSMLLTKENIEALIAKVKSWLGFLFKAKLRKAIVAAAVDTGNLAVARGPAPLVDGFESWLLKTDAGVLARVKRIASERGTATFS